MSIPEAMQLPVLRRFPLRRQDVDAAGGKLRIVAPESSRALLLRGWASERLPHWADIWPASVALARRLMRGVSWDGKVVVDLGCGVGVAGLAAGSRGAHVLFADLDPNALEFARFNAGQNRLGSFEVLAFDWSVDTLPPCDLLLLGDLAYEFRFVRPLLRQVHAVVESGGATWIADPGRPTANDLFEALRDVGRSRVESMKTNWGGEAHELRLGVVEPLSAEIEGSD